MPIVTKTNLIPKDRYVAVTTAGAGSCRLQARAGGIRVCVAETIPDRDTKDYLIIKFQSNLGSIGLPTLGSTDIVWARADVNPTLLTVLSDKTVVSAL